MYGEGVPSGLKDTGLVYLFIHSVTYVTLDTVLSTVNLCGFTTFSVLHCDGQGNIYQLIKQQFDYVKEKN